MKHSSRLSQIKARVADRFSKMRLLQEVSGAFGDLGTFLPLMLGLSQWVGLDVGTTLLFSGLYNVITGLVFDVPMPVQPMKAIAAVAIAAKGSFTLPQVMAAGMFVSACVLVLGLTGLMGLAGTLIPGAVIRGMQLGLGLTLAKAGWQQVWYTNQKSPPTRDWWSVQGLFLGLFALVFILLTAYPASSKSDSSSTEDDQRDEHLTIGDAPRRKSIDQADADDELETGVVNTTKSAVENEGEGGTESRPGSAAGLISTPVQLPTDKSALPELPHVISLFLDLLRAVGAAATKACDSEAINDPPLPLTSPQRSSWGLRGVPTALILTVLGFILALASSPQARSSLRFGPSTIYVSVPLSTDWSRGILDAGLPQLALTSFNSVISVCALALQMFPGRSPRPATVSISVGLMNLFGGWFGAMPCCHGSGGLAAQARYGARYGTAPLFLGIVKILFALVLGSSLSSLLEAFPSPILGAMLVFAGAELAAGSRGQRGHRGMAVMLLTAAVLMAMNNVAVGVVSGLIAAYSLAARDAAVRTMLSGLRG